MLGLINFFSLFSVLLCCLKAEHNLEDAIIWRQSIHTFKQLKSVRCNRKMSIKSFINKYFSKQTETSDNHSDTSLQTHYYRITKEDGLEKVNTYLKQNSNYQVKSISKEYGEIMVNKSSLFIVISIVTVSSFKTAIDLTVTSNSVLPIGLGASTRCIQHLYKIFDEILPLYK